MYKLIGDFQTPEKILRKLRNLERMDEDSIKIFRVSPLYVNMPDNRKPRLNLDYYITPPDHLYCVYEKDEKTFHKIYVGKPRDFITALKKWHKIKVDSENIIENMDSEALMNLFAFMETNLTTLRLF